MDMVTCVAVGYQCLAPYYGYLLEYNKHTHDYSDSRYVGVTIVSYVNLLI